MDPNIKLLIAKINPENNADYFALHGTSISFIERLIENSGVYNGGNFNDRFYILLDPHKKGVDIFEAATYYANVNAIKDYLLMHSPDIKETMIKNDFDPYLFHVGLSQYIADQSSIPAGFQIFNNEQLAKMIEVIGICNKEDRRGVIIYFSDRLAQDFDIEEMNEIGQASFLLNKPLLLEHILGIKLLGNYEINKIKELI